MSTLTAPLLPCVLELGNVQLEPLTMAHAEALEAAAACGELWRLRVTSVPEPGASERYIQTALEGQAAGHMLPFAVRDLQSGQVVGSTRYHDIIANVARLEIGYTWYAKRYQRTHLNTTCKLMLLTHAFEKLGAQTVGWRTDNFNWASQRAIERLGAKRDGVIRGHALRRDGTVRDTVIYSVTLGEWPEIKAHLIHMLDRHAG
jgi:RimJ/RimL family protein N-acetyltransferase